MASYKLILFKIFVKIFNVVYSVLQFLGIELIPVSLDGIIKELTEDEKEIFLKQDFTEPVKIIVEACNTPGNSLSGTHRFFLIQMIRYDLTTQKVITRVCYFPVFPRTGKPANGMTRTGKSQFCFQI